MDPAGTDVGASQRPADRSPERDRTLARLFKAHHRRLERIFVRRGHGREDARDLVQEVFLRLSACDVELLLARPGCMVYRMARFVSVDAMRRRQLQAKVGLGPWDGLGDREVDDGQPTQEQRLVWRETICEAVSAIRKLPPMTGEAIWLHRVEDLSSREIAERQGIPKKTVQKRIATSAPRLYAAD